MTSLLPYNTFHLDVRAQALEEVTSVSQLQSLVSDGRVASQPFFVLGGGSNVLLNQDIQGLVLLNCISGRDIIEQDQTSVTIRVGGGEVWHDTVMWTVEQGRWGLENLALIPGSVGASPIQNIGAYGVEAKDTIVSVSVVDLHDGVVRELSAQECQFGYRDSIFKRPANKHLFVTHVVYRLSLQPRRQLTYKDFSLYLSAHGVDPDSLSSRDIAEMVIEIRRAKLPDWTVIGTAGSFFKNPVVSTFVAQDLRQEYPEMPIFEAGEGLSKLSAGRLIDQCGYKNTQRGPVGTYERHALVLVHHGGGTGAQVRALAQEIMQAVADRFGVQIEPEVNIW